MTYWDQLPETRFVIDWITRMSRTYGGGVYGYGKEWDWGQALAVECHGPDPAQWPQPDPLPEDAERARRWENGEWPDWVEHPRPEANDA